jgi:hypothetical protein
VFGPANFFAISRSSLRAKRSRIGFRLDCFVADAGLLAMTRLLL